MTEKQNPVQKGIGRTGDKAIEQGASMAGEATGTVAGGAGGAAVGAVGGAIVGSVVPGAGTVAGAKAGMKSGFDTGSKVGGEVGKQAGKLGAKGAKGLSQGAQMVQEIASDPAGFLTDKLIEATVGFFVPVVGAPIAEIVKRNKGVLLVGTLGMVLTIVMLVFPPQTGQAGQANNYEGLPIELQNYIEDDFVDTPTPQHSPFGGRGTERTIITSYFHDPNYYRIYGRWHDALDIVPNYDYYRLNKAYKIYGDVIMFATCSGKATGKVDRNGANYIETKCKDGVHTTWHLHNKLNFIPTGETVDVVAGQPIAVMGETGLADGAHIHYTILKNGGYVDPLPYLNN